MSGAGKLRLLAVGAVWLVILSVAVVAYKWIVAPAKQQEIVEQTQSDPRHKERVRVALDSFSGYSLLRSPEFAEELTRRGIGLDLVDDKADYSARLKSIKRGETPLAVFTIDALVKQAAATGEMPATIVAVIDETTGADAMIAYKQALPNLDALNQAQAKIVATPDSPSETLARVVTANFHLPALPKDRWINANGAADVFQRFKKAAPGEPRAYVLWEPYVSKALEDPRAHVLLDSSRFRGYIVDVLVANREFLLANEELVQKFVEAYLTAAFQRRQTRNGMQLLVEADAKAQGEPLTAAQAEKLVEGVWWKNTQENYAHFGIIAGSSAKGLQHLDEMIRGITAVLVKTGAIARDPANDSPNKLYYDKVLRRLYDADFHPGLAGAGSADEAIRAAAESGPLREEDWPRLRPFGKLQVEAIVFARSRADLREESHAVLDQLVDVLRRFPQCYLLVRGHARPEGDPEANKLLAQGRAQAAADYVTGQGIAPHRLRVVSADPATSGGEAQSVTFVLGQMPY